MVYGFFERASRASHVKIFIFHIFHIFHDSPSLEIIFEDIYFIYRLAVRDALPSYCMLIIFTNIINFVKFLWTFKCLRMYLCMYVCSSYKQYLSKFKHLPKITHVIKKISKNTLISNSYEIFKRFIKVRGRPHIT